MSRRGGWLGEQFFRRQAKSPPGVFALTLAWPHAHTPDDLSADHRFMQGKKAAGHHFPKRCCRNATLVPSRCKAMQARNHACDVLKGAVAANGASQVEWPYSATYGKRPSCHRLMRPTRPT